MKRFLNEEKTNINSDVPLDKSKVGWSQMALSL